MTHRGELVTDAAWEEAHAFEAARTSYHAWHWARFKCPPDPPEPTRLAPDPLTYEEQYPQQFAICPRCGESRRLGPTTRKNPLSPCRGCQKELLAFVPKEHRRRGFATTEGYAIALATERESRDAERKSRRRAIVRRSKARARDADPEGYRARAARAEHQRRARHATDRDTE